MSEQKFIQALKRYKAYADDIKQLQDDQARVKEYILGYVKENGSQEYEGSKCYMQDRSKIVYDVAQIKKRIGKRSRKFIDDKLSFDTSYFLSICKENGLDPHMFLKKNKYDRQEKVNEKVLTSMIDKNEIYYEEMEGCYTIQENNFLVIRLN